jgi:trans-2,3-dihydro-3-hydroxyanthranilate isomerase
MVMREFEYRLCDVFTDRPLVGNQLAIFLDAGALSDAEMQALACETNLSETTFICRRDADVERERGVRVRIFTTEEELPFAGHPTLGTAATIRSVFPEFAGAERVVLDLNVGQVPVVFDGAHSGPRAVFGEMTQPTPRFGQEHDPALLAPVLGLEASDFAEEWKPQTVSTGMPFAIVILRSIEALGRLRVDAKASERYLRSSDAKFFYTIAPESEGLWRARMQFYNGEDPATGSAAGCAISYLVKHRIVTAGERLHMRQGIEMGRPSDLYISANRLDSQVSEVRVGGSTVHVATGRFFLE